MIYIDDTKEVYVIKIDNNESGQLLRINKLFKRIIRLLAAELCSHGHCIPDYEKEICKKNYTMDSPDGCINCWIRWAEKRVTNGT